MKAKVFGWASGVTGAAVYAPVVIQEGIANWIDLAAMVKILGLF